MTVTNQHIESATALFQLTRKSDEDLVRIRDHFRSIAHLAVNPINRRDSEALVAGCQYEIDRRSGRLGSYRFTYDSGSDNEAAE